MIGAVVTAYNREERTVDVTTVEKEALTLKKVPYSFIMTPHGLFHFPPEPGTGGILVFPMSKEYMLTGRVMVEQQDDDPSGNALFIPGLNSFTMNCELGEGVALEYGINYIRILQDTLELGSGATKVTLDDGKFSVKNNTAELVAAIEDAFSYIKTKITTPGLFEYINSAGVVTPCTVSPTIASVITDLEEKINKIKSFT